MFKQRRFLGIVAGDRTMVVAEISWHGGVPRVRRAAEWVLPDPAPGVAPGISFRQFLRAGHIAPAPVIFGLPARWLLLRVKTAPATDPAALAGLLRLEAEQDFALPPAELAIDYLPGAPTGNGLRLTMLAARRERLEFLGRLARDAGLKTAAVTPVTLALANADPGGLQDFIGLYLGAEAIELTWYKDCEPCLLRHLGTTPRGAFDGPDAGKEWATGLAAAVRQLLELVPGHDQPDRLSAITLWDDSDLPETFITALESVLPLPVRRAPPPDREPLSPACLRGTAGAAALLFAAGSARDKSVDFLHSRLALKKQSRRRQLLQRLLPAAAVIGLAAGAALLDLRREAVSLDDLRRRLAQLQPEISAASTVLDYADSLRGWRENRSPYLECLREITSAYRPNDPVWVTSLAIRDGMRGLVSGKAADSRLVMSVLDRLKENLAFDGVNLVYVRSAGTGSTEISYAIGFTFAPAGETGDGTERKQP